MPGRAAVASATLRGVEAVPIEVEVAVSNGIPSFHIVGLADVAVQESRARIKAALSASECTMPAARIVVNLAPSGLKKTGSGFDLPIAVALLVATGQLDPALVRNTLFVGELSLEGAVRPVDGLLAYALTAKRQGLALACAPAPDRLVAIEGLEVRGVASLVRLRAGISAPFSPRALAWKPSRLDFKDIAGNDVAKRAMQIAATGRHGLLMMGPPGSGKTMLAARLPSILPPLSSAEALAVALVHSVAGLDISTILAGECPFRAPHHSATLAGLIGGGSPPHPGEISLAHRGVLFLDELAEFKPSVLQGLRQPLESGRVVVTRVDGNVAFPADFMLVGASNPCPCGYLGDPQRPCTCSLHQVNAYRARIGGPLLDRIDMHIDVRRTAPDEILDAGTGTSSAQLAEGVVAGRSFALWRRAKHPEEATTAGMVRSCRMSSECRSFFETSASRSAMSARAIVRTLSIARTIADIAERESVERDDIGEALAFRLREGEG